MAQNEEQLEEIEALNAIYDGDGNFTQVNSTTFQYKFDSEDNPQLAFLLEISWPVDYPAVVPQFNLNTFFNNHLSNSCKKEILNLLIEEAEKNIGSASSFSLIEWARESAQDILKAHEGQKEVAKDESEDDRDDENEAGSSKKEKKVILSKRQKKTMWEKCNNKGEKARGYDWVCVIRHLSQSGSKPED